MINPKDTAAQLAEQMREALEQLQLPAARRRDLEEMSTVADDLSKRLDYFHEEYALLDLREPQSRFDDAYNQWDALDPGRVEGSVLERIVTLSQPLGTLNRAGIDITAMKKFDETETSFAIKLGDNFAGLGRGWDDLKRTLQRPSTDFRFQRQHLQAGRALLASMEKLNMFQVTGFDFRKVVPGADGKKSGQWVDFDVDKIPSFLGPKALVRARLQVLTRTSGPLVTGEWLNAYAAHVVHDHLRRNDMPHEIFTNVVYRAPEDIISVSGDFDVMVQAGDKIAIFECKSGQLSSTGTELATVVQKADAVRSVIASMAPDVSLTSFLLFNPSAAEPGAVADGIRGSNVRAITPNDLRRVTKELFVN